MKKHFGVSLFAILAFLVLIFDTKTALAGAQEGISLCLQTVIPSLFPFLFISALLTSRLTLRRIPMGRFFGIPKGAEHILLIGFLGGYPVGAQTISDCVLSGTISRENGKRLLAFCSNAGPAFLFGVGSGLFPQKWMCWALWAIHIVSALLIGTLLPAHQQVANSAQKKHDPGITAAQKRALQAMAIICGWVVLFRIVIVFCQCWFLWLLPPWAQCLVSGMLELTNGCISLANIQDINLRFVLFAAMLSFGGLCVTMQTYSVCTNVDRHFYLPGKLGQALLSTLLAIAVISREITLIIGIPVILSCLILFVRNKTEKGIAFSAGRLYNNRNYTRR